MDYRQNRFQYKKCPRNNVRRCVCRNFCWYDKPYSNSTYNKIFSFIIMKLTLFSNDKLLYDVLKREFNDILIQNSLEKDSSIVIFDSLNKDKIVSCMEKINDKNNKLIININDFSLEETDNIIKPFRLNTLLNKISDFYKYFKDNIFIFPIGTINRNRQTLTIKNTIIQFTKKETEVLIQINDGDRTKEDLLNQVWNSKSNRNNTVETTIYNIRQKLLQNGVKDFIVCENGLYSTLLN